MTSLILWRRAVLISCCGFSLLRGGAAAEIGAKDFKAAQLFQTTNVWSVQLKFTPEQWDAMEPKGGTSGFAGMFGGGGQGGFGAGLFLAPGFLRAGDQDRNNQLSQAEFHALGEKWFAAWDTNNTGKLAADQLRTGLAGVLAQANLGMPAMGGQGSRGFLQGTEGQRNGLSSLMGVEFQYVHADLEFQGAGFKDVAVRYKGNGTFVQSRGSLKRSLKVDLNEFVTGQKLAGVTKLNFHNSVADASWMNEVLALRLFRDAGVPASRTAYARVLVTVPGKHDHQYFGLYSLVEDVDNNFAGDRFGSKKGALFKPSLPGLFTDLGDDWKSYQQPYDPKTELTAAQKQRVVDFSKLVSKADDVEFTARLGDFLDLDQFARFMAVTVYLSSLDSILGIGQNYYVYLHPTTQKFQFLPWDHDHSFGQFPMGGGLPENLSIQHPWQGDIRFLDRVFKVEAFKRLYLAKLDEFSKTIFEPNRLSQQVDEIAAAIRLAVKEESGQKLAGLEMVLAGETPTGLGGMGGFGQSMKPIKGFVTPRAQSISDQLAGKSQGFTPGSGFGFGGTGNRAGLGGAPGGAGGLGGGAFLGNTFITALDLDKDGALSRDEFTQGFARWFNQWNTDKTGSLTDEQLRAGLNKDLPLTFGGIGTRGGIPPARGQ